MKRYLGILVVLGLFSGVLLSDEYSDNILNKDHQAGNKGTSYNQVPDNSSDTLPYVPNEIIVKYKQRISDKLLGNLNNGKNIDEMLLSSSLDELHRKHRISKIKNVFPNFKEQKSRLETLKYQDKSQLNSRQQQLQRRLMRAPKSAKVPNLNRIYKLELELEEGQLLKDVVAAYNNDPDVEYAELNYLVRINLTPNDPLFSNQWALPKISAPQAWDIETGSSQVIVAVVDTGVDYNHRDLDDNMWTDGSGYYGYDFLNNDNDPIDDHGHGTHCSGIISAEGNNGLDISGACWNVKIMALKFLDSGGNGDGADAVEAFYYAVNNGADVVSNSWGGEGYMQSMQDAIDYAYSQGVIMVSSAGNDNANNPNYYPANFNHMISVAATDSDDQKASFSNFGDWVDIAAPGVDILSLRANGTSMGSVYDNYTTFASGTSMACPYVAGACAMLLSMNPILLYDEVYDILFDSADPIAPGICLSNGRLNLSNAIFMITPSKGIIRLDREAYSCSDVATIALSDGDLKGYATQALNITTGMGDAETVILTENSSFLGIFTGTISTSSNVVNIGDGVLQISHGEIITATYEDDDDGSGNPATATDTAQIDCEGPVFIDVQVQAGSKIAIITFETDEPSTGQVRCDMACGGPYTIIEEDLELSNTHTIKISGLQSETTYNFVLDATDASGNQTTNDNNGNCYSFTTGISGILRVPSEYPTIQAAIDDSFDGDTVIVAPGTYTGSGNRDLDFGGKAITVESENGPENCIIDCQNAGRGFYFYSGEGADSIVKGLTIINGTSSDDGGGIYIRTASSPTIINCTISNNHASDDGGGIYSEDSGNNPTIIDCIISGNQANDSGGGIGCRGGGVTITNCWIIDNSAAAGGGINLRACSATIADCFFTENTASANGGAIICKRDSDPIITNCTFTDNTADHGGGINSYYDSDPILSNCIFWGNTATLGSEMYLIYNTDDSKPSSITVSYSDVQGGQSTVHVEPGSTLNWQAGNIDADPILAFENNFHLMGGSPCIDAGDPGYIAEPNEKDMDGDPRIMYQRVDMGADEYNDQIPYIAISTKTLEFSAYTGQGNPGDQIISIRNSSRETLNWEVVYDCDWLQIDPNIGSSTGEIDDITLSVDTTGLSPGRYNCLLTISDPTAFNSPQTVEVNLLLNGLITVPGDYPTIQAAIDVAPDGYFIWVADGVYTGDGNRDLDFGGKAITVESENGPDNCIIDCEGSYQDQHRAFNFHSDEPPETILDGFTIINGYAGYGSGIYIDNAYPTIRNCIIRNCTTVYNGAIACDHSAFPTISNCIITDNLGITNNVGGGGIYAKDKSGPQISECTITNNVGNGIYFEGGIAPGFYINPLISNCTITNNSVYGIRLTGSHAEISHCTIAYNENSGIRGTSPIWNTIIRMYITVNGCKINNNKNSGISYSDCVIIATDCIISSNYSSGNGGGIRSTWDDGVLFKNCIISKNIAGQKGGGAYSNDAGNTYVNCTFIGNEAKGAGGGYYCQNPGDRKFTNCIFWNNISPVGPQMAIGGGEAYVTISNSDAQGGESEIPVLISNSSLTWGTGNIDTDPCFALPGDYLLLSGSPCIDAGTNSPYGGLPLTDLYGSPRILDGDGNGIAIADMGAYEFEYDSETPVVSISQEIFELFNFTGQPNPEDQSFSLRNCGGGTLNWEISDDSSWLQATPENGNSTGEIVEITLSFDSTALSHGEYTGTITISDPNALNNPRIIVVNLYIADYIHVPEDFATIQEAIDAVNDRSIIDVADGIYTGTGNRDITFNGKVIIVRSENGPNNCIIDCQNNGSGFLFYEEKNSILDGFTIINGDTLNDGGGISITNSGSLIIKNCKVINCQSSGWGGGIVCFGGSPLISGCYISGNSSVREGGGIALINRASPKIKNCTIVRNSALNGGALYVHNFNNNDYPKVENSIFWNNSAVNEIAYLGDGPAVTYSDIQGGWSGTGNIDTDPLFVEAANGDYHLLPGSPCINAGDPSYTPEPNEVDLDGQRRVMEGRVDMGADEYSDTIPVIVISPENLSFSYFEEGDNPPSQSLSIWNEGLETLNWQISEDCPWLAVNPSSGSLVSETEEVTVSVDIGSLDFGTYQCQLTITDPNAFNSPQLVPVFLSYIQRYPYGDVDMSYVVDISDFGNLAGKWLLSNCTAPSWCDRADINKSTAVDEVDLTFLAGNWQEDWFLTSDPNLLSKWKFEENGGSTAFDSIGPNHGTLRGDTNWVTGKIGNYALDFDGNGDYVEIGDKSSLEGFSQVTITGWVYWDGSGSSNVIAGKEQVYKITIVNSELLFLTGNNWAGTILTSSQQVPSNSWTHVAATYDGSIKYIYINGVKDTNSLTTSGSLGTSSRPAGIGASYGSGGWESYFNGSIDDVMIFNRALSYSEIQQLYQQGSQ